MRALRPKPGKGSRWSVDGPPVSTERGCPPPFSHARGYRNRSVSLRRGIRVKCHSSRPERGGPIVGGRAAARWTSEAGARAGVASRARRGRLHNSPAARRPKEPAATVGIT
jgi:hypothetical protein